MVRYAGRISAGSLTDLLEADREEGLCDHSPREYERIGLVYFEECLSNPNILYIETINGKRDFPADERLSFLKRVDSYLQNENEVLTHAQYAPSKSILGGIIKIRACISGELYKKDIHKSKF